MISFLQLFRQTAQALTSKRDQESTRPAAKRPSVKQSLISDVIWDWPKSEPIRVDVALERFPQFTGFSARGHRSGRRRIQRPV